MRVLGSVVVVWMLVGCSRWEAADPGDMVRSNDVPSHSLVITDDRAYELTGARVTNAKLSGHVLHTWSLSHSLPDTAFDDLSPDQIAHVLGWQPVQGPRDVALEGSAVRAMRVYQESSYGSVGAGAAGTLGTILMALIVAIATISPASCGRPLRVRGKHRITPLATGTEWIETLSVAPVAEPARRALIEIWTEEAQAEHAAVAAFSKLSLELIALGAPPDLVERSNRAAVQEVRHARLCFGIASAYTGRQLGPAPFPEALAGGTPDLERLARESLVDGCLREGMAADIARIGAATAQDPTVASVLRIQAEEEAQHAELGWAIVEWCLASGGEPLRERLLRSIGEFKLPRCDDLPEHGRVPRDVAVGLMRELVTRTRARLLAEASCDPAALQARPPVSGTASARGATSA